MLSLLTSVVPCQAVVASTMELLVSTQMVVTMKIIH